MADGPVLKLAHLKNYIPGEPPADWIPARDYAAAIGVSYHAVYGWIRRGYLPFMYKGQWLYVPRNYEPPELVKVAGLTRASVERLAVIVRLIKQSDADGVPVVGPKRLAALAGYTVSETKNALNTAENIDVSLYEENGAIGVVNYIQAETRIHKALELIDAGTVAYSSTDEPADVQAETEGVAA